jgi:hypothetical protein
MYGHMAGWGWLWLTVMPLVWIALLGAAVYVAVRLASRDSSNQPKRPA